MPNVQREQNKQLAPIGLRAFFKLADEWGLSIQQQLILLGQPSRSTFYNWRAEKIAAVPHDTLSRLSHLLAIHRALWVLFGSEERAKGWMFAANQQLGGRSALERMLAGDLTDIATIRAYLDQLGAAKNTVVRDTIIRDTTATDMTE